MGRRVLHARAGGMEHFAEQHHHPHPPRASRLRLGTKWGQNGVKGSCIPVPPVRSPVPGRGSGPLTSAASARREQVFLASLWKGLSTIFFHLQKWFSG